MAKQISKKRVVKKVLTIAEKRAKAAKNRLKAAKKDEAAKKVEAAKIQSIVEAHMKKIMDAGQRQFDPITGEEFNKGGLAKKRKKKKVKQ